MTGADGPLYLLAGAALQRDGGGGGGGDRRPGCN
jgi:hypothetical protein